MVDGRVVPNQYPFCFPEERYHTLRRKLACWAGLSLRPHESTCHGLMVTTHILARRQLKLAASQRFRPGCCAAVWMKSTLPAGLSFSPKNGHESNLGTFQKWTVDTVDTQTFAGPLKPWSWHVLAPGRGLTLGSGPFHPCFSWSPAPRPAEFVELQTDTAFPEGKGGSKEAGQNCALVSLVSLLSLLSLVSLVSIHPASHPSIHPFRHLAAAEC